MSTTSDLQREAWRVQSQSKAHKLQTKLYMYDFGQCDAKRCTGRRLAHEGMIKTISNSAKFSGIVLSATTPKVISREDKELLQTRGLCVVDCSWREIEAGRLTDRLSQLHTPNARILPFLLGSNPISYGKVARLSCAEAIAAGLYIVGLEEDAYKVMSPFSWGSTFFALNGEFLERYKACASSDEILEVQKEILDKYEERPEIEDKPDWAVDEEEEEEDDDDEEEDGERDKINTSNNEEENENDENKEEEEENNMEIAEDAVDHAESFSVASSEEDPYA